MVRNPAQRNGGRTDVLLDPAHERTRDLRSEQAANVRVAAFLVIADDIHPVKARGWRLEPQSAVPFEALRKIDHLAIDGGAGGADRCRRGGDWLKVQAKQSSTGTGGGRLILGDSP